MCVVRERGDGEESAGVCVGGGGGGGKKRHPEYQAVECNTPLLTLGIEGVCGQRTNGWWGRARRDVLSSRLYECNDSSIATPSPHPGLTRCVSWVCATSLS